MKQKYTLVKDVGGKQLIIREFGELDKDIMSLLCEETFDAQEIEIALTEGKAALISALRTNNLYPPAAHAERIAETVVALYQSDALETTDILFDDKEALLNNDTDTEEYDDLDGDVDLDVDDDEADDLDELLDDDDINIQNTTSAIKIADDDSVDIDEDS